MADTTTGTHAGAARQPSKRTAEEQEELIKLQHDELVAYKERIEQLENHMSAQLEAVNALGDDTGAEKIIQQAGEIQELQATLERRETEFEQTLVKVKQKMESQLDKANNFNTQAMNKLKSTRKQLKDLTAVNSDVNKALDQATATSELFQTELRDEKERQQKTRDDLEQAHLEQAHVLEDTQDQLRHLEYTLGIRKDKMIELEAEVEKFQETALRHIEREERAKMMAERVILAAVQALSSAEHVAEGSLTLVEKLQDALDNMQAKLFYSQAELSDYWAVLPPAARDLQLKHIRGLMNTSARTATEISQAGYAAEKAGLQQKLETAQAALEMEKKSTMEMQLECPVCMVGNSDRRVLPCEHWFCFTCTKTFCDAGEAGKGSCPQCEKNYTMEETQKFIL